MVFNYDGSCQYFPGVFQSLLLDEVLSELSPTEETITMFGKEIVVPRLISYQGTQPYTYSKTIHPATPFSKTPSALIDALEVKFGHRFNSCLANLYRDGRDYMGYHRDNEPELDTSCIASISLGATRTFKLRHRTSNESISLFLKHGDLLLMNNCQENWEHSLTKTTKSVDPRLNLTFRKIK